MWRFSLAWLYEIRDWERQLCSAYGSARSALGYKHELDSLYDDDS